MISLCGLGPALDVSFPMSSFLGLDNLPAGVPDSVIKVREETSNIKLRPGSNVSIWERLEDRFQGSLATPGTTINWMEGNPIYTRYVV